MVQRPGLLGHNQIVFGVVAAEGRCLARSLLIYGFHALGATHRPKRLTHISQFLCRFSTFCLSFVLIDHLVEIVFCLFSFLLQRSLRFVCLGKVRFSLINFFFILVVDIVTHRGCVIVVLILRTFSLILRLLRKLTLLKKLILDVLVGLARPGFHLSIVFLLFGHFRSDTLHVGADLNFTLAQTCVRIQLWLHIFVFLT